MRHAIFGECSVECQDSCSAPGGMNLRIESEEGKDLWEEWIREGACDDDDNIVCSDGRKYNGNTHGPVIEGVNAADGTAQDGDILMAGECIFIYKCIDTKGKFGGTNSAIIYHACTNIKDGHTFIGPRIGVGSFDGGLIYRKAYKDECEQLFAKLKTMGFGWDAEKKKTAKIKED